MKWIALGKRNDLQQRLLVLVSKDKKQMSRWGEDSKSKQMKRRKKNKNWEILPTYQDSLRVVRENRNGSWDSFHKRLFRRKPK